MHTYRDFATDKLKRTRGTFKGWTKGGPLGADYAIFANRATDVLVPVYCLTPETRAAIGNPPSRRKVGDEATCANCDKPIVLGFIARDGAEVWNHGPAEGMHTVCDWHEGMEPTERVATPK